MLLVIWINCVQQCNSFVGELRRHLLIWDKKRRGLWEALFLSAGTAYLIWSVLRNYCQTSVNLECLWIKSGNHIMIGQQHPTIRVQMHNPIQQSTPVNKQAIDRDGPNVMQLVTTRHNKQRGSWVSSPHDITCQLVTEVLSESQGHSVAAARVIPKWTTKYTGGKPLVSMASYMYCIFGCKLCSHRMRQICSLMYWPSLIINLLHLSTCAVQTGVSGSSQFMIWLHFSEPNLSCMNS